MDIMMPMLDGMQAARLLRQKDNKVALVFVTTMRQYAVQGYEVDACDFLVKPVTYPEFALKFTRILTKVPQPDTGREVFLKTENSFVRLSSRDILYVEVKGHYCIYHNRQRGIPPLPDHEKRRVQACLPTVLPGATTICWSTWPTCPAWTAWRCMWAALSCR